MITQLKTETCIRKHVAGVQIVYAWPQIDLFNCFDLTAPMQLVLSKLRI